MKVLWCWRCRQDMPMLDEDEYQQIWQLYGDCMHRFVEKRRAAGGQLTINEVFEPVRKEYERMTGMADCHENAIMHHRTSIYGPPCRVCGKPLRTPRAKFCAACGERGQLLKGHGELDDTGPIG
jgi:hypothetical protein